MLSAQKKLQESVVKKLYRRQILKLMVGMKWVEWAVNCGQGDAGRKTDEVLALYCLLATVPSCVCWTSDCPQRTTNKWSQRSNPTSESGYLCFRHHSYKLNDKVLAWLLPERSGIAPHLLRCRLSKLLSLFLKAAHETTDSQEWNAFTVQQKRLLRWCAVVTVQGISSQKTWKSSRSKLEPDRQRLCLALSKT